MHTSNPGTINQTVGGVGHNIALAAHRVSGNGKVRFCSMVGDDVAGSTILTAVASAGLDASISQLDRQKYPLSRTAQYVALNDADKNLFMGMSDFSIFDNPTFDSTWSTIMEAAQPKWLVVDANWQPECLHVWIRTGRVHGAKVAFEPVSEAKSQRLFPSSHSHQGGKQPRDLPVYPTPLVDLATPNNFELASMYNAAKQLGHFDSSAWFAVLDAFNIRGGARERFLDVTGKKELVDAGYPVMIMNLLPYIPTIITKFGADGALLTTILGKGDPRLRDPDEARYVIARCHVDHPDIGGVYMRMFPAVERVEDAVSVNGIGDTFMGVLVAGLAMGGKVEKLMDVAQQASVLTLKSKESVSPEVASLNGRLRGIAEESG